MNNTEMMKLDLTRREICQINLSLTHLICEIKNELNNEDISADGRKPKAKSGGCFTEELII